MLVSVQRWMGTPPVYPTVMYVDTTSEESDDDDDNAIIDYIVL